MIGWLKVKNAAQYSDMSQRTIRAWLREGLRHARVKGTILIKSEWIDEYLEFFECRGSEVDSITEKILREVK